MKKLLLAGAAFAALGASGVWADALDPLHGYDIQCTPTCVDVQTSINGISPLTAGDHFGFIVDQPGGGNATGDFTLAVLVPTNVFFASTPSVTGTLAGNTTSRGVWSSGDLETFLGLPNGSPNNPIGAFAPTSGPAIDTADPTVTAFVVFSVDLGSTTLLHTLAGDPMSEFVAGLPAGSLIAGFLTEGTGPTASTIDTANSSVLMVNATGVVPVPAPIVGAGIPGLIAGCFALLGLAEHRRRRNSLA